MNLLSAQKIKALSGVRNDRPINSGLPEGYQNMRGDIVKHRMVSSQSFDRVVKTVVCLTTIFCALAILILGIFSANFDAPDALNVGLAIICACGAALFILLSVCFVYRLLASQQHPSRERMPGIIAAIFYFTCALGLAFATIRLAASAKVSATYQEANTEVPGSFPGL